MPFNWFKKSAPETKSVPLSDPLAAQFFAFGPTVSGNTIGPANALKVPAVSCAVALISETIGALPFKLYDRDSREAQTGFPAY